MRKLLIFAALVVAFACGSFIEETKKQAAKKAASGITARVSATYAHGYDWYDLGVGELCSFELDEQEIERFERDGGDVFEALDAIRGTYTMKSKDSKWTFFLDRTRMVDDE